MSELKKSFFEEAARRFQIEKIEEKDSDENWAEIGRRYVQTFLDSPDVREKYTLEDTRIRQGVLHCFHAGVIVALYELTEEDFVPSEKTFAVLTNMDTVFFSELMSAGTLKNAIKIIKPMKRPKRFSKSSVIWPKSRDGPFPTVKHWKNVCIWFISPPCPSDRKSCAIRFSI